MEPEMMGGSAWYKSKLVWLVVVVVVVVGAWAVVRGNHAGAPANEETNNQQATVDTNPKAGEVAIVGKLGCMPLKSGKAPVGDECVLGLAGSDGMFYALNTSQIEAAGKGIEPNSTLKIVGKFTPVDTKSEEAGVYKYDGVIAVRVMGLNK